MESFSEMYAKLSPHLDERTRRLVCASRAEELGHGGITLVHKATGVSRRAITRGIKELTAPPLKPGAVRRSGGGRKRMTSLDTTLLSDLAALVEPTTSGDPMRDLRYTSKSTRKLSKALKNKGHNVSATTVARELHSQRYSLKGNRKVKEGASSPLRNGQIMHINRKMTVFKRHKDPVVSGDAKKKELIGNFKNGGEEWSAKGETTDVNTHDFPDKYRGKATPYGIYDVAQNKGFILIGTDHDTGEFAVQAVRRWWYCMGKKMYPKSWRIYLVFDGGGSNGSRNRLFKIALQRFADEVNLVVHVSHYPPGTSKHNKIEHRMFCFITGNWRATPLETLRIMLERIKHTSTEKGLSIEAEIDFNAFPIHKTVSKKDFNSINIRHEKFNGQWNYVITPRNR